ncbi:MAG: hypothetical protein ACI4NO_00320, partial [Oxalobacter sp.]
QVMLFFPEQTPYAGRLFFCLSKNSPDSKNQSNEKCGLDGRISISMTTKEILSLELILRRS